MENLDIFSNDYSELINKTYEYATGFKTLFTVKMRNGDIIDFNLKNNQLKKLYNIKIKDINDGSLFYFDIPSNLINLTINNDFYDIVNGISLRLYNIIVDYDYITLDDPNIVLEVVFDINKDVYKRDLHFSISTQFEKKITSEFDDLTEIINYFDIDLLNLLFKEVTIKNKNDVMNILYNKLYNLVIYINEKNK